MPIPVWDWKLQYKKYEGKDVFDCMIAEFLLSEGKYPIRQEVAFKRHAVTDLGDLYSKQRELLSKNEKLYRLFSEVEMPLVSILYRMEHVGIAVDTSKLRFIGEEIVKEIHTVEETILQEFGTPINLSSPAQVGSMLAAKFNVPLKKTPTGQFATGERELAPLAPMYPIITSILWYRELTKLKTTYVDPLLTKIAQDGRIHPTWNQVNAITGRLSSSNPNMQNIPVTSDFGKKIKSCFVALPDAVLISFDYSQQELRILAHMTQEQALISAFTEKKDIHRVTASQLFNTSYDNISEKERAVAKTINFGIIYGMSSFGLARTLAIPVDQAQLFIDNFFETFPAIRSYYDTLIAGAKKNGYIETLLGRRRYVFADNRPRTIDNATYRELINFPIQGTAADLMKKAMVNIDRETLSKQKDIRLLLQIHDELVFEIHELNEQKRIHLFDEIKDHLLHVYPLTVPLEVEITVGTRFV